MATPLVKFLDLVPGEKNQTQDGSWMCCCPAHDDNTPSLHVSEGSDGTLLLKCMTRVCTTAQIVQAVGLTMRELFPEGSKSPHQIAKSRQTAKEKIAGKTKVAEYDYCDADGAVKYQAVRYEDDKGMKTFMQRRPDGKGRWVFNMKQVVRIPFRLPELLAASKDETVFLCYSDDTEVLTPTGWVEFKDLDHKAPVLQYQRDTEKVSFAVPVAHQEFSYEGPMINIAADWCDLLVTPDHRQITRFGWRCPVVIPANKMGMMRKVPSSGFLNGREGPSEDEARLVAAWVGDGVNKKDGRWVAWNLKKPRKKKRIRQLLLRLGISWKKKISPSVPAWELIWVLKSDMQQIFDLCDAKLFSWDTVNWSLKAKRAFIDELRYWDGDSVGKKGLRFFTSDLQNAEVVSAVAATCGFHANTRKDERQEKTGYIVNLNDRTWRTLAKKPQAVFYSGMVYCCTVPNGFLVVRRNGKVAVSGNCEGEKKVEALRSWGLTATCNVGGAGKWLASYNPYFRGRNVVILPDNDPTDQTTGANPGLDHARKVLANLDGIARTVRILELPGLPDKGDIVDWQAEGNTKQQFLDLVAKCQAEAAVVPANPSPLPLPPAYEYELQLLSDLNIEVLGEMEDGNGVIKIFSGFHRSISHVREIGKMSLERLIQIAGPRVKQKVMVGSTDAPKGMYRLSDVRQAIALIGGARRLKGDSEVGRGCWPSAEDLGQQHNAILIVGDGEAAKWNGKQILERIEKPLAGGRVLNLGTGEAWYDFETLADLLQKAGDQAWCLEVADEAENLFARWCWKSQIESPSLIVGLIMATWVQTIFAWRPQVAIIGASNTGKSTLFETLSGIFGQLTVKSSGSSAAGIRQAIKQSAPAVLIDEFESGKHRADITDMLRSSSRGDKVLRGTTGHKGSEFTIRHIVWIAAIESGLDREADRNRFLTLELTRPPAENMGKLISPDPTVLGELGQKLLAISVRHGLAAAKLAVDLKAVKVGSVHPRVIESLAVPAAMLAQIYGGTMDSAEQILKRLARVVDAEETEASDTEALIEDILQSAVFGSRGDCRLAGQWIAAYDGMEAHDAGEILARVGIDIISAEDAVKSGLPNQRYIFFATKIIKKSLLKGTKWENVRIDQILNRIPGTEKRRHRMAGVVPRGFFFPFDSIVTVP